MSELSALRQEIIQAQKARADFQKWKLIIVAALSSAALGIATADAQWKGNYLLLCCVPPVCLYVDLLCAHLTLRILVIGDFFRTHCKETSSLYDYEAFVARVRSEVKPFVLEDWAMYISTGVLSIGVAIVGLKVATNLTWPYPYAALIGVAGSIASYASAGSKADSIRKIADELKKAGKSVTA